MLVKYNQSNILLAGQIKLIPGVNTVEYEKWLEIATHPQILAKIEEGVISVLTDGAVDNDQSSSIAKFKSKDALKLVRETVDVSLLKKWQAEDKRGDVLAVVQGQIDKILKPSSDKKKLEKDSE